MLNVEHVIDKVDALSVVPCAQQADDFFLDAHHATNWHVPAFWMIAGRILMSEVVKNYPCVVEHDLA